MLKKSATSARPSATSAADGTSIITPEQHRRRRHVRRRHDRVQPSPDRDDLLDRRDHRQHDPHLAAGRGFDERPQLVVEEHRTGEAEADAAHAERRVGLGPIASARRPACRRRRRGCGTRPAGPPSPRGSGRRGSAARRPMAGSNARGTVARCAPARCPPPRPVTAASASRTDPTLAVTATETSPVRGRRIAASRSTGATDRSPTGRPGHRHPGR